MEEKEKLETVSYKLLEICIEKGLTISEMNDLAIVFPRVARKRIQALEGATVFTLSFAQGDSE